MRRTAVSFVVVAALAVGLRALAAQTQEITPQTPGAQAAGGSQEAARESFEQWFVELTEPPVAGGGTGTAVRAQQGRFRMAAEAAGIVLTERYAFETLFNGMSLTIDPVQLAAIARLPEVRAIYPVLPFTLPEPIQSGEVPELATALAMTGADIARTELGLTGQGVKVGVIDSGIDYHHPDLGGCFGPGCRVAFGFDFVGDAYTGANTPVPDGDPDDCGTPLPSTPALPQTAGHGTHVTGIVGANGTLTGVAPGVTFGAYRVFGCNGGSQADVVIAAMERALADGMQIVNMSIGSALQWPQYPTAAASTRLVDRGVAVIAAAGNEAAFGLYGSSAPAVGEKAISVASFVNTHSNLPHFTISPDGRVVTYQYGTGAPLPPTSGTHPMARTGTASSTEDACNSAPALPDLTGRVALVRRGTCPFYEKVVNAQTAGALAVVIYNNVAGGIIPNVVGQPAVTIPVVGITAADGVEIDARLAAGPVSLTWQAGLISTPLATGGLIATSSSWGVAPDLTLKPDIGAPGGTIRSTYPLELGGYATLGGTSMASPHVAGAVALLLEARPNTPSQSIGRLVQNAAVPRLWWGNPELGFLDNVHRQGAGLLRIDRALLATTHVEPGKLSLGESEGGPVTRRLTIRNQAAAPVTFLLSHEPTLATGPNTFTLAYFGSFAAVAFSPASVTVPAGGTDIVDVTITAPAGLPDRGLFGGYIVLTPNGGGAESRVPYSGFKGDYQSIPVLTPASQFGNPLLRATVSFGPSGPVTIVPASGEVAWVLLHLDHPVRRVRVDVFDAVTGQAWNRAFDIEYLGRNSGPASFFPLPWDGVTQRGSGKGAKDIEVPAGQYELRLSVQKALGDSANPAHWEHWTSPPITIIR